MTSTQMHRHAGNPYQSMEREGLLLENPSSVSRTFEIKYPEEFRKSGHLLSVTQGKFFSPYLERQSVIETGGIMTLEPFSTAEVSFEEMKELREESKKYEKNYKFENGILETPYYFVEIDGTTGEVLQVTDRETKRELLSKE